MRNMVILQVAGEGAWRMPAKWAHDAAMSWVDFDGATEENRPDLAIVDSRGRTWVPDIEDVERAWYIQD